MPVQPGRTVTQPLCATGRTPIRWAMIPRHRRLLASLTCTRCSMAERTRLVTQTWVVGSMASMPSPKILMQPGSLSSTCSVLLRRKLSPSSCLCSPRLRAKNPFFGKMQPVLQNALPRPVTPFYPDISNAIQQRVHSALTKQSSVTDALSGLQTDLQAIVNK